MIGGQVLFYGVFELIALLLLRRYWKMRSIRQYSSQEVRERLRDRNVLLLDVRTVAEHRAQAISGFPATEKRIQRRQSYRRSLEMEHRRRSGSVSSVEGAQTTQEVCR